MKGSGGCAGFAAHTEELARASPRGRAFTYDPAKEPPQMRLVREAETRIGLLFAREADASMRISSREKREQISVQSVLMRGGQSMRCAGIVNLLRSLDEAS